ncbi:hypothetical protein DACRYDRAFT_107253 [Dacryopinax primogenitus]|uniref:Uncharacterized protein n=1 Tax=Dacryopinax primogenitus (strain DJM 731) TaxID=1858805 RepID=M5FWK6_DACPD|nr:uncharacterized protein DACRYDRAFT_107253 [Dacryopinax primogenitus]EJU02326.1 hypothetical protein DACRYDRAFT_107253 [Dacryopinax primogenitus]
MSEHGSRNAFPASGRATHVDGREGRSHQQPSMAEAEHRERFLPSSLPAILEAVSRIDPTAFLRLSGIASTNYVTPIPASPRDMTSEDYDGPVPSRISHEPNQTRFTAQTQPTSSIQSAAALAEQPAVPQPRVVLEQADARSGNHPAAGLPFSAPQPYTREEVPSHTHMCQRCNNTWAPNHRCGVFKKPWEEPVTFRYVPWTPPTTPPVAPAAAPSPVVVTSAAPLAQPDMFGNYSRADPAAENIWSSMLQDLEDAVQAIPGRDPIHDLRNAIESAWYVMQVSDGQHCREMLKPLKDLVETPVKILDPKYLTPTNLCQVGSWEANTLAAYVSWARGFAEWPGHFDWYGGVHYAWLDHYTALL